MQRSVTPSASRPSLTSGLASRACCLAPLFRLEAVLEEAVLEEALLEEALLEEMVVEEMVVEEACRWREGGRREVGVADLWTEVGVVDLSGEASPRDGGVAGTISSSAREN